MLSCIRLGDASGFGYTLRRHQLRSQQPDALSTKVSMLGNGYESVGQALFKSVKSTHILHFKYKEQQHRLNKK